MRLRAPVTRGYFFLLGALRLVNAASPRNIDQKKISSGTQGTSWRVGIKIFQSRYFLIPLNIQWAQQYRYRCRYQYHYPHRKYEETFMRTFFRKRFQIAANIPLPTWSRIHKLSSFFRRSQDLLQGTWRPSSCTSCKPLEPLTGISKRHFNYVWPSIIVKPIFKVMRPFRRTSVNSKHLQFSFFLRRTCLLTYGPIIRRILCVVRPAHPELSRSKLKGNQITKRWCKIKCSFLPSSPPPFDNGEFYYIFWLAKFYSGNRPCYRGGDTCKDS